LIRARTDRILASWAAQGDIRKVAGVRLDRNRSGFVAMVGRADGGALLELCR
jgi:hypothetical protein